MLTVILIGAALALAALIFIISRQPDTFRYSRTAVINAPASLIFDHVDNFARWESWSPWAKLDPLCKNTFEGPSSGKGSVFRWDGNNKVGQGVMTITESRAPDIIVIQTEFLKPMKAVNNTAFTFAPQAGGTLVTWSMYGPVTFVGKAFNLFVDCEKMVGGMYEKGLASLKSVTESKAPQGLYN